MVSSSMKLPASYVGARGPGGLYARPSAFRRKSGLYPVPRYGFTVEGMRSAKASWVPESCTLPTAEQPLRAAEFDELFASALRGIARTAPTTVEFQLDASAEGTARALAERESACCSFFTFTFSTDPAGQLLLEVTVPAAHIAVLEGLFSRAVAGQG
jgi:hypothetical protein